MKERNAEIPDAKKMEFRIGVNIGDVIHDGGRNVMKISKSLIIPLLIACLAIAVAIGCGEWSINEDLYMALAAGRDVLEGQLAKPDQWSYLTEGKVWVNQNWLSGLIFYLSWLYLGDAGPIVVKGTLLVLCLMVVYARSRFLELQAKFLLPAMLLGTLSVVPFLAIKAEQFGVLYFLLFTLCLVAPRSYGWCRQVGSLLVLLLWANSHGSFILGPLLMAVKICAQAGVYLLHCRFGQQMRCSGPESAILSDEIIRLQAGEALHTQKDPSEYSIAVDGAERSQREILLWIVTLGLSMVVIAFANPFGAANLQMIFQQTGASEWTRTFGIWKPLINFPGFAPLGGFLSTPFLVTLLLTLSLGTVAMWIMGRRCRLHFLAGENVQEQRGDFFTDLLVCLAMIAVTLKFARTLLFVGLAIIPLLAFFAQVLAGFAARYAERRSRARATLLPGWSGVAASLAALVFMIFAFVDNTLIPLLPGNPFLQDSPLTKRLMGPLAINTAPVTEFMIKNGIKGRVFSTFCSADVLLLRVPGVQVFTDCRAQSIYSEADLKQYLVVGSAKLAKPESIQAALEVLDQHKVSCVVLVQSPVEATFSVREVLVNSGIWRPIFADPLGGSFLFVKNHSELMEPFRQTGRLDHLRFPSPAAKVLSEAFMYQGASATPPDWLKAELRAAAVETPTPLMFRALSRLCRDARGCVDPETRSYLLAELKRLERIRVTQAGGYWILRSRLEILQTLKHDHEACPEEGRSPVFSTEMVAVIRVIQVLRSEFFPWGLWWPLP
jgi:hypothetical protein